MRYYIIAGEASGDLHGSNLIKELKKKDSQAIFRVWGGDLMKQAGAELVKHYKHHAVMGFIEVLKNYKTIKQNFKECKLDILKFNPHLIIFIDYSGFNMRIAKIMKPYNYKLFYYIAPQIWAWRKWRVKKVKRLIDKMFVILPFEKEFYKKRNYEVNYVGHPLLDEFEKKKAKMPTFYTFVEENKLSDKPVIALLPGSREQEISVKLPLMLKAARRFPDYQFVIAGAPAFAEEYYDQFIGNNPIKVLFGKTYEILNFAKAALVTSGTATLETALFRVPHVVCFKTGVFTYRLVKSLVDLKFISLVNIIMDKQVNRELIQMDLTVENLTEELNKMLHNKEYRAEMLHNYEELHKKLGGVGASKRAAEGIFSSLQ